MEVHVSLSGRGSLADQIYRQLRSAIRGGHLRPFDMLPSSRELADRLSVSRNTVTAAYDRLAAEGLVETRPGVGAFVGEPAAVADRAYRPQPSAYPVPQPVWETIAAPVDFSAAEPEFDLRVGFPSRDQFPYAVWRSMMARHLRPSALPSSAYAEPAGTTALRKAIARHVSVSRGVRAVPDDVFVTNGTQQAVDLIARVLLAPGDVVVVEDPGYPPPAMLFRSLRLEVVGVPVDDEGIVVTALPDEARLVFVTPSHQFPLGMSMSMSRRRQLIEWAERVGAVILEDDYDSEFRYTGRPLAPLQSMDESWRVIYIGSFAKTLLPTLRLGFMVAPPSLMPALRKAKFVTDWHTTGPTQDALAQLIDEGQFAKHIRRMRRIYAERHELIVSALDTQFGGLLHRIPSSAGLHVAALLRPEVARTDRQVVRLARRRGVGLSQAISSFSMNRPARSGLVLGYGAIPTADIPAGLQRLEECLTEVSA